MLQRLKKIPWLVWAAMGPIVIIGGVKLCTGGRTRVPVVGSGALARLVEGDAPKGFRYDVDAVADRSWSASAEAIRRELATYPDVIVFGFDGAVLDAELPEGEVDGALVELERLTDAAEASAAVPVVVGFHWGTDAAGGAADAARLARVDRVNAAWRRGLCQRRGRRICVALQEHVEDRIAIRAAIGAAVTDAMARHDALVASTQEHR